ncbi:alpha/beta fold hydrolase [Haloferax volcanii]|uniref:alpha/beta fold hydrolase n=1 Tax=Haloferax volcanii TaxID=2246 RepID=UPI00249B5F06|nr:alpha/beta hydrolase [Haloferax alexandrinus]
MQTVVSTDGTRIAYETHGDGPPLILLHGGGTRRYWDPVIPYFDDDYMVVVPDRRGRGESDDRDEYSLDCEVEDVCAVIDAVAEEPILFGHSFGGLRALEAARRKSVSAVIAYEPAVLVGDYREKADLVARMQERLDAGDRRGAMRLHLREVLHGDISDDAFEQWLAEWPAWPDYTRFVESTLRMNRVIEAYDLPDTIDIDAPVLLLTGSDGPSHLRDSIRAVDTAVPESQLVEFENLGHNGPVIDPEHVSTAVQEFLQK